MSAAPGSPLRKHAAAGGDPHLATRLGERVDVDFSPAGFVGMKSDPVAVGREPPELLVEEELELIEQYLRIQRYRFGARLHATVAAERGALTALVPTLILQPLVENAVRYSVLPRDAGGSLWVSVRKEHAVLVVSVEDDGPGLNGGTLNAFGMGLQNSSERLNALYGAAASLTIGGRTDGTGCAVVIRLPFRLAPVRQPCDTAIEAATA